MKLPIIQMYREQTRNHGEPIRGREWWEAQHENAEVTHRIKCRYTRGITPNMRIKYGNTFFDIQSVIDPSMRNISLEIMATQRVS